MENRTQKDLSLLELKALVYDQNVSINKAQQIIKVLENEIASRPPEEKKEEVTKIEPAVEKSSE